ncbi:hypothetical protein ACQPXS_41100 [Streptomyces sp. CA-142005]|uniref:hypothetical protein n=1 Tax=Streptomyces sp. CA-142005 TaxID=3240052 RepID=UPI003D8A1487
MSYDVAAWEGERPADDKATGLPHAVEHGRGSTPLRAVGACRSYQFEQLACAGRDFGRAMPHGAHTI